jgi:hypothetical protein
MLAVEKKTLLMAGTFPNRIVRSIQPGLCEWFPATAPLLGRLSKHSFQKEFGGFFTPERPPP